MLAGYTQLSATTAPSTSRINTPSAWSKPQHDAVHRKGRTPMREDMSAPDDASKLGRAVLRTRLQMACPILAGNAVSAIENAAPERTLSGAQRPETVQARSLSPGLGGEFRVTSRIPGLQKRRGGARRNRTADLSMPFQARSQLIMPAPGWTAMRRFDRVYSRSGPLANECCGPSINSESAHTRASRRSGLFAPT